MAIATPETTNPTSAAESEKPAQAAPEVDVSEEPRAPGERLLLGLFLAFFAILGAAVLYDLLVSVGRSFP